MQQRHQTQPTQRLGYCRMKLGFCRLNIKGLPAWASPAAPFVFYFTSS